MLERDYILEIVGDFVEGVTKSLRLAVRERDLSAAADVEAQVAELLELDREVALGLAPDSLVTMVVLSGMGDSLAAYVCYALERVGRVYDEAGDERAALRHLQARAVSESFGVGPDDVPPELAALEAELF